MTISHDIKRRLGAPAAAQMKDLPQNWLFLGVGYTAKALISHLPKGLNLMGTSRNLDAWPQGLKARVTGLEFTGEITAALKDALTQAEVIIVSLPPSKAGDPFLAAVKGDIMRLAPNVRWAAYLSATSVYGDRAGQWAFEDELLKPVTARGKYRAMAELAWLETGLPLHLFRLAGISGGTYFGQSRNPFARLKAGTARAVIKDGHIVNRIHAEDISRALLASIAAPNPLRIYNLADGHPAPPQDVLRFAARLADTPLPPEVGVDSPEISDMARSFYSETKRISNARARRELGWSPDFETYQAGLMSIFKTSVSAQSAVMLAGYMDVQPARRDIIKEALPRHINLTRAEAGCLRFDVSEDAQIEGRLNVVEIFNSEAAFTTHQRRTAASDWAEASQGCSRYYFKA